ncbi:hypothetical protein L873DRAFT_1800894 [Choiromyces venosus 120613-1]|uniref:Uncharacterized protein n=1 Tax=Choiromyces venosus 120613-1 TaxID=1336337 RepID=A0A3N4JZ38_9PEZI|nr:hypothetical protein L873DRAFT_1800894 [Choiromyces venosus 120613-1]
MDTLADPFTALLHPLVSVGTSAPPAPPLAIGDQVTMRITAVFLYGIQGVYSGTNASIAINLYIPASTLSSNGLALSQDGKQYADAKGDEVLAVGGCVEVNVLVIKKGVRGGEFHAVCGVVRRARGRVGMLKRGKVMDEREGGQEYSELMMLWMSEAGE